MMMESNWINGEFVCCSNLEIQANRNQNNFKELNGWKYLNSLLIKIEIFILFYNFKLFILRSKIVLIKEFML